MYSSLCSQTFAAPSPSDRANSLNLPDEIWCQIFAHLPAKDRGNIRLCCSRFDRLCDDIRVQINELILWSGSSTLETFLHSRRTIRNVKFKTANPLPANGSLEYEQLLISFFRKHGGNILSLSLAECRTHRTTVFRSILESCTQLRTLAVNLNYFCCRDHNDKIPEKLTNTVESVLKEMVVMREDSTTFDRLEDLTFKVAVSMTRTGVCITNQAFRQFMALFPNVKRVKLAIEFDDSFLRSGPGFAGPSSDDQDFTVSSICHWLSAGADKLERLTIKVCTSRYYNINRFNSSYFDTYPSDLVLQTMEQITRIERTKILRAFSSRWSSKNFRDWSTKNPFLAFQNLTEFHFRIYYSIGLPFPSSIISCSDVIQLLVSTIAGLRSLTVQFDGQKERFTITKECFEALVESKLTSLKFDDPMVDINFTASSLDPALQPNYHLKILERSEGFLRGSVMSLFATYFRNLKYLYFGDVGERTFPSIFEQNNLQRLEIVDYYRQYADYHTCKQYLEDVLGNRSLPYLTHLGINEGQISLTKNFLSCVSVPKLISLHLDLRRLEEDDIDPLWALLLNIPKLRHLRLEFNLKISFQHSLQLIQSLPSLSNFTNYNYGLGTHFQPSESDKLFNANESLQQISTNDGHCFHTVHRPIRGQSKIVVSSPERCRLRAIEVSSSIP